MILRKVTEYDARFLYALLKERTPEQSISHKQMPSYLAHCWFMRSDPYMRWWIIMHKRARVGAVYVTREWEIGVHIQRKYRGRGFGSEAVQTVMNHFRGQRLLANIAPKNKPSEKMFKRLGFKKIQHTYAVTG